MKPSISTGSHICRPREAAKFAISSHPRRRIWQLTIQKVRPRAALRDQRLCLIRQPQVVRLQEIERGSITNREFRELCPELSDETIRRELSDMVDQGLIMKVGDRKATYYILK